MKKKIATVWLAGCSGCHMSLLDMDERILEVAKLADIVKSPLVDGKDLPEVDVALVEGAVSLDEHEEEIRHIRSRARVLVSLGDCAATGNVSALRNPLSKDAVLQQAYREAESNDDPHNALPCRDVGLLLPRARPLHEVVKVDHVIPGCPPSADLIFQTVLALLEGREPSLEGLKNG